MSQRFKQGFVSAIQRMIEASRSQRDTRTTSARFASQRSWPLAPTHARGSPIGPASMNARRSGQDGRRNAGLTRWCRFRSRSRVRQGPELPGFYGQICLGHVTVPWRLEWALACGHLAASNNTSRRSPKRRLRASRQRARVMGLAECPKSHRPWRAHRARPPPIRPVAPAAGYARPP